MARTKNVTQNTNRGDDLKQLIFNALRNIAIAESLIAMLVIIYGDWKIQKLEEIYPSNIVIDFRPRMSVKEQAKLYIQSLEIPPMEETNEEKIEEVILEEEQQINSMTVDENTENYYNPTEEERHWAYLIAKSEAGIEDDLGKTLVINVAINHMKSKGYADLIEEFNASGRYSSVVNGVPCIGGVPVTDDMLTDDLKIAVDKAFEKDYTEEVLKEVAESKGLDSSYYDGGATYFYNPKAISDHQRELRANISVTFQHGRHVFYRVWDQ